MIVNLTEGVEYKMINILPEAFGASFLSGQFSTIYNQSADEFRSIVSLEQFIEFGSDFNQGVEDYQLEVSTHLNEDVSQYIWLDSKKEKAISVYFDKAGMIHGITLAPFVSYPESDRQYTKNTYIMPIKQEWFVFWGGTNQFVNYHYVYESQRYAYDLIIMKNGQSFKDSPSKNEHYYAFNKEIVAPAAGKVVKVLDGIVDNVPGEMDPQQPEGNCVIIEHENNEYSMLAHLKEGSIVVKVGDAVQQGQVIGLCGNSGNSSEAHLHFQVMNSMDYVNGQSIRIRFNNGNEPIQGDFVHM